MTISALGRLVLIIPGYGLLFGRLGFPAIGMSGMASAASGSYWTIFIFFVVYFTINKNYKKYQLFSFSKPNKKIIKKIFRLGCPISIQFGGELFALSVVTLLMGWLGEIALAAQQVIVQINMLTKMVPYGLSMASSTLISQKTGSEEFEDIRLIGNAAMLIGIVFILLVASVYWLFPKLLISFYLDINRPSNLETVYLVIWIFFISAFSQIADAIPSQLSFSCC